MESFLIFALILVFVGAGVVWAGIKVVPQGQRWTVERFGRYTSTLDSGLNIIVPVIDQIGRKISVMERIIDVPAQVVITKDNTTVTADGVVFYKVEDVARAAYQVEQLDEAIVNLTMTNLRSVIGAMDLDDTLSNRQKINDQLLTIIDDATNPWGVKIIRIEIRDLRMSEESQTAMNLQMTAERRRRAYVTEAEGKKQADILVAEGKKQAAFLEAEARERAAEADAKATQMVSEAIATGGPQAIQFFIAQEYVKSLGTIGSSPNSKLVMIPLEAAGIAGAVAGVGAMFKDFGKEQAPPRAQAGPGAQPRPPQGGAATGGPGGPAPVIPPRREG